MDFKHDIFLSFHTNDNKERTAEEEGWITSFERYLSFMLKQVLGYEPSFLHNDDLTLSTSGDLLKTCVFIAIVSPDYADDQKNIEDIERFYENAKENTPKGLYPHNRIFKVIKSPISFDNQPHLLTNLLNYDLFQVDTETETVREFYDFFGPESEVNYWMKVMDLAYDIHQVLATIKSEKGANVSTQQSKAIFLGETGEDLEIQRSIIKREFQRHGYKVFPNHTLTGTAEEIKTSIIKDLSQCRLSIHPIGADEGKVIDEEGNTIIAIQNQAAMEYSQSLSENDRDNFTRLVWVYSDLSKATEEQIDYIESVKREMDASENAEVLQTPLEDLKAIIKRILEGKENSEDTKPKNTDSTLSSTPTVYLIYDKEDQVNAESQISTIESKGLQVIKPDFSKDLMTFRNQHLENLRTADLAIVYYGKVNVKWLKMKSLDIMKAPGLEREKGGLEKAVLFEKGNEMDTSFFKGFAMPLIEIDNTSASQELEAFLDKTTIAH